MRQLKAHRQTIMFGIMIMVVLFSCFSLVSAATLTTGEAMVSMSGVGILVLLILGLVYIIGQLPSKDAVDESGSIVHVSQLKHLRSVLWVFVWGLAMAILFIFSNICLTYLPDTMIGELFFVLWRISFYVIIIGVPIYFIWIIYKVFKDAEMKKLIERGVEMRGTP